VEADDGGGLGSSIVVCEPVVVLRLICFLIGEFLLFSAEQEADEAPVREASGTWTV
jgi:hypothetical protein